MRVKKCKSKSYLLFSSFWQCTSSHYVYRSDAPHNLCVWQCLSIDYGGRMFIWNYILKLYCHIWRYFDKFAFYHFAYPVHCELMVLLHVFTSHRSGWLTMLLCQWPRGMASQRNTDILKAQSESFWQVCFRFMIVMACPLASLYLKFPGRIAKNAWYILTSIGWGDCGYISCKKCLFWRNVLFSFCFYQSFIEGWAIEIYVIHCYS